MNGAEARGVWDGFGWTGVFRLDWKTEEYKVRKPGTEDIAYFPDQNSAEVAAWRAKHKIERPLITRDGVTVATRSEADQAFPGLRPLFRNGKRIEVERKKA